MPKQNQPAFAKNPKNLLVWQKSMDLVRDIYLIAARFPDFEKFSLRSQLTRACYSIPANFAEGNGQLFPKKEINFFNNALGSCAETITWIAIALQNQYITQEEHDNLEARLIEIQKMAIGYIRKLQEGLSAED